MSAGNGGGAHPRTLARQFATALVHLRDQWDVAYVSARPMRQAAALRPSAAVSPPAATASAEADTLADEPNRASEARAWSPATKLEYLRRRNVGDCQRCPLARTRTNIVFGVGDPNARVMFVGEAPGADEDRLGEPFVGRAGQRLDRWLAHVGLAREQVYIANVLKCRPPGNRDPRPDEVDRCSPFLHAQIRAITPRVIVALGRHAGMLLARRDDLSLRAMRTANLACEIPGPRDGTPSLRVPLVVTYHPSYVLRQEGSERADAASGPSEAEALVLADLARAIAMSEA